MRLRMKKMPTVGQELSFVLDGETVTATVFSLDMEGNAVLEIAGSSEDTLDELDLEGDEDELEEEIDEEELDAIEDDLEEIEEELDEIEDEEGEETAAAYKPRRRVRSKRKLTPQEIRVRALKNRKNKVKKRIYNERYAKKNRAKIARNAKRRLALNIVTRPKVKGYTYNYTK